MTHEELTQEAIELLERLVAVPRHSREETAAADLLEQQMQAWGLAPRREGNNLWSLSPDWQEDRPTLLLNAHIDTVRPTAGWTRDPYRPTWEGERLYGLGTNDDGASLVSLLSAFRKHVACGMTPHTACPYNIVFLASAEEEVSGRDGMERVLPLLPRIDVGLVGEPTGMQPAVAEKGLMVLDCIAHGQAGHAARDEGDNAIYRALEDIEWFRTYRFPKTSDRLGAVKMTVTIINAGTQHNVVPAECRFTVDVRSNELYTNEDIYNIVRAHVGCDVQARSFRLNSSSIPLNHPLVQRCLLHAAPPKTPFGSPTLSDQALMPFPTLKIGPGQSCRSHTADEYILRSEVADAIAFYSYILGD